MDDYFPLKGLRAEPWWLVGCSLSKGLLKAAIKSFFFNDTKNVWGKRVRFLLTRDKNFKIPLKYTRY
jgi:hypothetical protein